MESNLGYISCTRKPTQPIDYMGNTTPKWKWTGFGFQMEKSKVRIPPSPSCKYVFLASAHTKVLVSNFKGPVDAVLQCYSTHVGPTPHISEVEALNVKIEEADERMVPNLMHTIHDGVQRMMVHTADNDVFILMMYHSW